ncbi:hypothetical protein M885DRAFT_188852 [Pelagophyceae sp. CCMP2097]|nr:hypothetical protein M885DRAFT_188852 [Pelagophyceae sp. CCMP2097]
MGSFILALLCALAGHTASSMPQFMPTAAPYWRARQEKDLGAFQPRPGEGGAQRHGNGGARRRAIDRAAQRPGENGARRENGAQNDRRPRCDVYMQKHWAFAGGGFLTRDRGRWHPRADGSRAYDVEPCRIVRYAAEDARRCLKGRHLFFIGDSVTRYQAMSLIYFLERSEWPDRLPLSAKRCQANSNAPKQACGKTPNICVEGDWRNGTIRNWPNMLAHIGGGEDGSFFHGRVECLCARDVMETTVQNVLYRGASQVNVSFLEQTGHTSLHG